MPLESLYYLRRTVDGEVDEALDRQDSIVLLKGPRHAGKTSLLARALAHARSRGGRTAVCSLRAFNSVQTASATSLLRAIAQTVAEQLETCPSPEENWDEGRGANASLSRYLRREVLPLTDAHLVLALDDVDRLLAHTYAGEILALLRSWHNERALNPAAPWHRLSLVVVYSSEASMFVMDPNQSPFNVGSQVELADFSPSQVAELNARQGAPMPSAGELDRFFELVGGCPYLVRRGLDALASGHLNLETLMRTAADPDGVFGGHLQLMLRTVRADPALARGLMDMAQSGDVPRDLFVRLRSAGILAGDSEAAPRFRCGLYRRFLKVAFGDQQ